MSPFCLHAKRQISETACAERVLMASSAELATCRTCPHGQDIMAEAKIGKFWSPSRVAENEVFDNPADAPGEGKNQQLVEHKMPKATPNSSEGTALDSITVRELSACSKVEVSSIRNIVNGKTLSGKNFERVTSALAERGLTLADVVVFRGGRKAAAKPSPPEPGNIVPPAPLLGDFPLPAAPTQKPALVHIPLEELVAEITRRIPRAEVVLR